MIIQNVCNHSVYEQLAKQLATLVHLEFTFSEGYQNLQRGPVLAKFFLVWSYRFFCYSHIKFSHTICEYREYIDARNGKQ